MDDVASSVRRCHERHLPREPHVVQQNGAGFAQHGVLIWVFARVFVGLALFVQAVERLQLGFALGSAQGVLQVQAPGVLVGLFFTPVLLVQGQMGLAVVFLALGRQRAEVAKVRV